MPLNRAEAASAVEFGTISMHSKLPKSFFTMFFHIASSMGEFPLDSLFLSRSFGESMLLSLLESIPEVLCFNIVATAVAGTGVLDVNAIAKES